MAKDARALIPQFNVKPFLVGLLMGLADLVPGVSGGTIAVLMGVYPRLIRALGAIEFKHAILCLQGQWRRLWHEIDLGFLLLLGLGVVTAIFSAGKLIHYLLHQYPIHMDSLFLGMILSAALALVRALRRAHVFAWLPLYVGLLVALMIGVLPIQSGLSTVSVSSWQFLVVFAAGMVGISAMILPGISGSFILLLLGIYPLLIASVANLDFLVLAVFGCGCVTGLLLVSRLVAWLFKHFLGATMSFLTGLMIGSVGSLWPWRYTLTYRMDSAGEKVPLVQENLLPWTYGSMTGNSTHTVAAVIIFIAVATLVFRFGRIRFADTNE